MPQGQYKLTDAKPIGQFSLADAQPVSSAPAAKPEQDETGFWREWWQRSNPIEWVKGAVEAAKAPMDGSLSGYLPNAVKMIQADPKFLDQAKDAANKGEYLKAGRKVLSYLSMGLGHDLDYQSELLDQGKYRSAAGAMAGTATSMLAPDAVVSGVSRAVAALPRVSSLTPEAQAAVDAGHAAGVPIDAATATGNRFVRAAQHVADRTLGGSVIASRADAAQAQGLATMGEQLAAKGHALPVTAEDAGQAVRDAVTGEVRKHGAAASSEYDALRTIEADPANTRSIPIEPKPGTSAAAEGAPAKHTSRFANPGATTEDLWQGVLGDARRNGFKGSADDLKAEFLDRLRSGREGLKDASKAASDVDTEALLTDIRRYGGISDKGGVWSDINELDPSFRSTIKRKGGAGIDDMASQLRQDPKWAAIIPEDGATWLQDFLDKASRGVRGKHVTAANELEHALQIQGVEPGAKWWTSASEPTASMQLPVDLRPAKAAIQPIYDQLKRASELVPLQGDKGRALVALDRLMNAGSHAPLSVVDEALGELKSFARADVPELRSAGQGVIAHTIGQLDQWVKMTAEAAGPGALDALERGRAATVAKYGAAEVLDALHAEPVTVLRQLTTAGDAGIERLRAVAQQAPGEMPKVGRAFLDGLLEKATSDGGFKHGARIAADWEKLGTETKRLLYKDPNYIRDLDNFFRLAKMSAETANASGTGHVVATISHLHSLLAGPVVGLSEQAAWTGIGSLLHSRAGVKLLTEGLKLPVANKSGLGAWLSRAQKFAAAEGLTQAAPSATEAR
jgi:hypothetical protein